MNTNNIEGGYTSNDSPTLGAKIKSAPTENLESKLKFLGQCGVNDEYIEMFAQASLETTNNLVQALGDQPSIEEVGVANAYLSTEFNTPRQEFGNLSFIEYSSQRVRGAIMAAANDNLYTDAA